MRVLLVACCLVADLSVINDIYVPVVCMIGSTMAGGTTVA